MSRCWALLCSLFFFSSLSLSFLLSLGDAMSLKVRKSKHLRDMAVTVPLSLTPHLLLSVQVAAFLCNAALMNVDDGQTQEACRARGELRLEAATPATSDASTAASPSDLGTLADDMSKQPGKELDLSGIETWHLMCKSVKALEREVSKLPSP